MHLIGISGSLRAASYNTALLRAAFDDAPDGVTTGIVPLAGVPVYDQDELRDAGMPGRVSELRSTVTDHVPLDLLRMPRR